VGRIWDGGDLAQEVLERVRAEVIRLQDGGHLPPALAAITVGESSIDERIQGLEAEACHVTGVSYQEYSFAQRGDHRTIVQTLAQLNADLTVTGITIRALSPTYVRELAAAIAPGKDVDGLHPLHLGRFITNKRGRPHPPGAAIVQLLKRAGLTLVGAHVICIGNASGLADMLTWRCLHENATVSTWRDVSAWPVHLLPRGDILIIDTNNLPSVDGASLKPGVVVVDARSCPDGWMRCRPEGLPEAVSLLIPVPGGAGPMTIAMRLAALIAMYRAPAIVPLDS
jgi:methylenetetrahydrofolate dehydrogenase (NADP+) / methenyltetrahydrofolate cyclohydrolase